MSLPLARVVTSDYYDYTLWLFALLPGGSLEHLSTVGGRGDGPLQFMFTFSGGESGSMAFTEGPLSTLLVTDAGNHRVQEVCVRRVDCLPRADPCLPVANVTATATTAMHPPTPRANTHPLRSMRCSYCMVANAEGGCPLLFPCPSFASPRMMAQSPM